MIALSNSANTPSMEQRAARRRRGQTPGDTMHCPAPLLAKDPQNERLACDIRLRAERRAGHLLREKAKGSGSNQHEERSHDTTGLV